MFRFALGWPLLAALSLTVLSCASDLSGPQPSLDSIVPALACNTQLTTTITLQGQELSPLALDAAKSDPRLAIPDIDLRRVATLEGAVVNGELVRLPNDPDDPSSARVTWTDATTMSFDVYPEQGLTPGLYEITVSNRNGASASLTTRLTIIPEPSLEVVTPDLLCTVETDRSLTLSGSSFALVDGVLPTVQIGDTQLTADALEDCSEVAGAALPLSLCSTLIVTLPQGAEDPGALSVSVTNPAPAACSSLEIDAALVPEPTVAGVEPDLFCTADGAASLTITGTGFIDVAGELPTVLFGDVEVQASAISDCQSISGTLLAAQSCTTLNVDVPTGAVADGVHKVFVRNPDPAGCTSNEDISALVAGPPTIAELTPPDLCSAELPSSTTATGSGFIRVDDGNGTNTFINPEVFVDDGNGAAAMTVSAMGGCVALVGTTVIGDICTSLTFDLPDTLAEGSYAVTIINPAPASCEGSTPTTLDITGAPTLVSVAPATVCAAGDTLSVTGTGFTNSSTIVVGGIAIPTALVSATEITGTIEDGFTPGTYDVLVRNGLACDSNTLTNQVTVAGVPVVFFVDPPFNHSSVEVRLTVWVSGINGATPTVSIRPTGTADTPTALGTPVFNGTSRIFATLPAGIAAGDYDVLVDDDPCPALIINALHLTDTETVHVSSISPEFGADDVATGIILRSDNPTPANFENFEATPRAYLTPDLGGAASELLSVSFEGADKLSGVVPAGLTPGTYSVIVINPDGDVGVLAAAFRVLPAADPPPEVSDLVPSQVSAGAAVTVAITGSFFPANTADVEVTAQCLDPSDVPGGFVARTATVAGSAFGQIDTTWDMSGLAGFVCLIRVSNLDNATFTEFSALAVTNASGNINSFSDSAPMSTARRALGAAALRLNNQSRFLFAAGGDDGAATPVRFSSVESAPVDAFGDVGSWTAQRNALPESRAFHGSTQIGRYTYIAGGRVGDAPGTVSDSVLRAYLLDPQQAPSFNDISLEQATTGLPGGIWYYRVAAVMAADDANNPAGEALASQPFVVQLPDLAGGVDMTLFWSSVPGADRYRIYRSPTPGLALGNELLLAEVAHDDVAAQQSFVDDNSIDNTAETATALPLGSLGVWHSVGTLNVAREGAAFIAAPDPVNQDMHYLYVMGGRDAGNAVLGSYEYVAVTAVAGDDQTLDINGFATGAESLDDPRWLAGALYLDATRTPELQPDTLWVYVLKGSDAAGSTVNAISIYEVDTANGGELINEHSTNAPLFGGGYGTVAGNNTIFVFGGGGSPSNQGRSGLLAEADCPLDCYPDLANLNGGFNLSVQRYLHAATADGAFIYLLGGQTNNAAATNSTERTNL